MVRLRESAGLHRRERFGVLEEEEEGVGEDDVRGGPVLSMLFPVLNQLRLVQRTLLQNDDVHLADLGQIS